MLAGAKIQQLEKPMGEELMADDPIRLLHDKNRGKLIKDWPFGDFIDLCGEITKQKQFPVKNIGQQVALMVTELGEAIEHLEPSRSHPVIIEVLKAIETLSANFETERCTQVLEDNTTITDKEGFVEELADVVIRIFSFIHGNNLKAEFEGSFFWKINYNHTRPIKHGKEF